MKMKNVNIKYREQNITSRSECLEAYFRDIKDCEQLTKDEEMKLIEQYKNTGDPKIREKILKSNLRFVISVAKDYLKNDNKICLTDLISEGNIGLMIALEKFEPATNFKFISYGVWWVRNKMLDAIRNHNDTIKHPHYFKSENKCSYSSLDKNLGGDDERTLIDVIENNDSPQADSSFDKLDLNKLINIITEEKLRTILKMKIGLENAPMTFKEIAETLTEKGQKISEQCVNIKYKRAIWILQKKLKNSKDCENLLYV